MIDISDEENTERALKEISRRVVSENIINEEIAADYIRFSDFEKKLSENNLLITRLEQSPDRKAVISAFTSSETAVEAINEILTAINDRGLFKFNPIKLLLEIDGKQIDNSNEKLDFLYFKSCLLSLPFNLLKEITVKNIIERFDYGENEFILKEFYRILSCGGKLYIECTDIPFYINFYNEYKKFRPESIDSITEIAGYEKNIKKSSDDQYGFFSPENILDYFLKNNKSNSAYSVQLLKAYLEYSGFINILPRTSVADYKPGMIIIDAVKAGLAEYARLPKKVLLQLFLEDYRDLLNFSVFIRNLHNAYNNWDLYLVTDKNNIDFFNNNIYLKYLDDNYPREAMDYTITFKNAKSFPRTDYLLKNIDSGKTDVFFTQDDIADATGFLKNCGINADDFFIIIDDEFIGNGEKENLLKKMSIDFPYLNLTGFKVLVNSFKAYKEGKGGTLLKKLAALLYLSSFYAGGGFVYELADNLYVPSYNKENDYYNYKRESKDYDVSIIIPVFNAVSYTKQCIASLFRNHPLVNFEIIVINNASTDKTTEYLSVLSGVSNFSAVNNEQNLGYAKACNQGAMLSNGKYLYLLNNDTILFKGTIDELFNTMEKYGGNCGAAGSLLLSEDGKIQHTGVVFSNSYGVFIPYHAYEGMAIIECKSQHAKNAVIYKKYNAVTAASFLIKRELFFYINLFDEIYKNGYEDIDLCFKIREIKKEIIFNPKSMLIHFGGRTEGRFNCNQENFFYLMNKWKFKYTYDDYIFAESSGLEVFRDRLNLKVGYYPISELREIKDYINLCFDRGEYETALELCDEVLKKYSMLDIKIYKKKLDIEKAINELREGRDRGIL